MVLITTSPRNSTRFRPGCWDSRGCQKFAEHGVPSLRGGVGGATVRTKHGMARHYVPVLLRGHTMVAFASAHVFGSYVCVVRMGPLETCNSYVPV